MWRTAELRWWWRGERTRPLTEWLLQGAEPLVDRRTDLYLAHAEATDIGIKQRGYGATEVKVLVDLPDLSLPPQMGCQAEIWVKSSGLPLSLTTGTTLPVGKTRFRRLLEFAGGVWHGIDSEEAAEEGVGLEISDVECAGSAWHTVCMEAFGPADRIEPLLQAAITLLGPWPSGTSEPWLCGGYPLWLSRLSSHAAAAE
ncbi:MULTISPECIES: hypothetical protein [Pacificimonas]|nr:MULTISPECIES: hypothetical protein [Pacificimonas]MBZ6378156.1 hypothetical protein [Pacificimonas aurantium]